MILDDYSIIIIIISVFLVENSAYYITIQNTNNIN